MPTKARKIKISDFEKQYISSQCQHLAEILKKQFIKENPDKRFNYLIDVYTKWYHNYLYFCEKFKSEHPNRILDEFEMKFVRLEYKGNDKFDFSYFRHTGQWFLVSTDLTLKECIEMIQDNPNFQPVS
ncbi:MAG: hypothetical protein A2475_02940 [Ignavibacteria bacterium RIFOXYC2_FULL_35_21]|nr:MAG: hypothetical protein A2220_14255 [Ignavibacteria bacterium RIFOXYA2_FULL_35_10]OGV22792.1 MAG: hypothetical protein A2475_02940 [Ignavibacteria bacterium RIFOXYC2_FULL_35_21]